MVHTPSSPQGPSGQRCEEVKMDEEKGCCSVPLVTLSLRNQLLNPVQPFRREMLSVSSGLGLDHHFLLMTFFLTQTKTFFLNCGIFTIIKCADLGCTVR